MELFKELTDVSRGVRRLGAAAVDLCHVALGTHRLHLRIVAQTCNDRFGLVLGCFYEKCVMHD